MVCLTIDKNGLDFFADLIYTTAPKMQIKEISAGFLSSNEALRNISQNIFETRPDISYTKTFKTVGGYEFDAFAKNKHADLQLWTKLSERYANMDFYLATYWKTQEVEEDPFLQNVISFKATYQNQTYGWKHDKDHSKVAVSVPRDARARICYGDINHTKSHRSGIIICFKDQNLHAAIDKVYHFEIKDNSLMETFALIVVCFTNLVVFNLMA